MTAENQFGVDCEELSELLPDPEEVIAVNLMITEPEMLFDKELQDDFDVGLSIEGFSEDALPEMDVAREKIIMG
jgi:hypothetical protein